MNILEKHEIFEIEVLEKLKNERLIEPLKIKIRKEIQDWDFQEKIAYSRFSTKQVALKAHTLEQTMKNKIAALMERGEIRDGFDIEFLLRQGVALPELTENEISKLMNRMDGFKAKDFKVKLGSVLEGDIRKYYIENRFNFFRQNLQAF